MTDRDALKRRLHRIREATEDLMDYTADQPDEHLLDLLADIWDLADVQE